MTINPLPFLPNCVVGVLRSKQRHVLKTIGTFRKSLNCKSVQGVRLKKRMVRIISIVDAKDKIATTPTTNWDGDFTIGRIVVLTGIGDSMCEYGV